MSNKDLQCESTRRILERDPSEDEAWFNRPMPPETIAQSKKIAECDDPGELSALLNSIKLDPAQVEILEKLRKNRPDMIFPGFKIYFGSSVSEENRSKAINAFKYTYVDNKPSLIKRFLNWLWKKDLVPPGRVQNKAAQFWEENDGI